MDAIQIFEALRNFLDTKIDANERKTKNAVEDPMLNTYLVGQGLAYREVRCFLNHIKSPKEDEK